MTSSRGKPRTSRGEPRTRRAVHVLASGMPFALLSDHMTVTEQTMCITRTPPPSVQRSGKAGERGARKPKSYSRPSLHPNPTGKAQQKQGVHGDREWNGKTGYGVHDGTLSSRSGRQTRQRRSKPTDRTADSSTYQTSQQRMP